MKDWHFEGADKKTQTLFAEMPERNQNSRSDAGVVSNYFMSTRSHCDCVLIFNRVYFGLMENNILIMAMFSYKMQQINTFKDVEPLLHLEM